MTTTVRRRGVAVVAVLLVLLFAAKDCSCESEWPPKQRWIVSSDRSV